MHESDAQKTAFSTSHRHYQFNRMPFGLKNALTMFQRLMDQVLSELQENDMFVYLNNIVIYASSLIKHQTKLNKFVERLQQDYKRILSYNRINVSFCEKKEIISNM